VALSRISLRRPVHSASAVPNALFATENRAARAGPEGHARTFYDFRLPSSIDSNFPTSIAINREWRRARPEDEIEIDFLAVLTVVVWKADEEPAESYRRPGRSRARTPKSFTYLNLVPIEWELAQTCEDCETKHRVARRIAKVAVASVNWDQCIGDWIALRAKESFIVFS
jgi:hypothetical protein